MKVKSKKLKFRKTKLTIYGGNYYIKVRGQGTNPNPNVMATTLWGDGLNLVIKTIQAPF